MAKLYQDTAEVRDKLLAHRMREYWEVCLWDASAVLFGGWIPLEDDAGSNRFYLQPEAEAGLRRARETYGSAAVLKLIHWKAQEGENHDP
jgi:hypothetical protein